MDQMARMGETLDDVHRALSTFQATIETGHRLTLGALKEVVAELKSLRRPPPGTSGNGNGRKGR